MSQIDGVIPLLVYEDIPAAHDFLVKAFGFEPGGVYNNDEGKPVHAEVRAGTTAIWLHRVAAEHEVDSPRQAGMTSPGPRGTCRRCRRAFQASSRRRSTCRRRTG